MNRLILAACAAAMAGLAACATTTADTADHDHMDHAAAAPAAAPAPSPALMAAKTAGEATFNTRCAGCHINGAAPKPAVLANHTPEQIVEILTTGKMMRQGSALSAQQKAEVATFLTGSMPG